MSRETKSAVDKAAADKGVAVEAAAVDSENGAIQVEMVAVAEATATTPPTLTKLNCDYREKVAKGISLRSISQRALSLSLLLLWLVSASSSASHQFLQLNS